MVDQRRSMADAMLSPDKVAFIRGNMQGIVPSGETEVRGANSGAPPDTLKSKPKQQISAEGMIPPVLVPLTTRLHPEVADALRRANLERRLKRQEPQTVQEIVEVALRTWLVEAGYLPSP